MTKDETEGGPAFPEAFYPNSYSDAPKFRPGMTLRDWFAGQALASVMQDRAIWDCTADERGDIAERMYQWADAMLKERDK